MGRVRFETVAGAQEQAARRLPRSVYCALLGGSERDITVSDNNAAFDDLGFAPPATTVSRPCDLSTTILGQPLSIPVFIAPTGVQAVHPDGEVAIARAAAARGTAMSVSSFGSKPIAEAAAANPVTFFQMYWMGGRDKVLARMERARSAGAVGLILTTDWCFASGRDGGSPTVPSKLDLGYLARSTADVMTRPRWLWQFVRSGRMPGMTAPNLAEPGAAAPTFMAAYDEWRDSPPPQWSDVRWLREQWGGPFMLKGVMRADDARRAVDAGVSAISVSNHGGNNLDGTPATIRVLPAIAAAVGQDIEVVLDGGIRRGSDVVSALAFGARAVMLGRASLWGLSAGGQTGVEDVLDIISGGIESTVRALGHSSIHDLSAADLVIPGDFTRPFSS